jgi:hypothetical protein
MAVCMLQSGALQNEVIEKITFSWCSVNCSAGQLCKSLQGNNHSKLVLMPHVPLLLVHVSSHLPLIKYIMLESSSVWDELRLVR